MHQLGTEFTILYFWDYDCGHCKKVTPKIGKLFPKYAGKSLSLWTVSINGSEDVWRNKLNEYGLDSEGATNVSDHARKTGFDYYYDIRSTPRAFLLDKNMRILAKHITPEQLEEILDREFGMEKLEEELDKATEEGKE